MRSCFSPVALDSSLTSLAHHFLNSGVSFSDLKGVLRCYALFCSVGELPHYEETLPAAITGHLVPYSPGSLDLGSETLAPKCHSQDKAQ